MRKLLPILYIIVAAVLWGSISLFYKGLSAVGFTQWQVVLLRVSTATVGMAIYILFTDPKAFRIHLKDLWMFIGTGVVSLAFFNFCYFSAMDHISVSVAATLLYTAPIFVMLLSAVLFHERLTKQKVLAVLLTFIGCVLVTGLLEKNETVTPIGILFGLGSGIGYALYSIFGVYALRRYSTKTLTFYTFLIATLAVLPLSRPSALLEIAKQEIATTIVCTLGIGVLVCLLPYVFYTQGLSRVNPSKASIIATLEPVVAALIGVFVMDDAVSVLKIVGMSLIVGAIVLTNIQFSKKT